MRVVLVDPSHWDPDLVEPILAADHRLVMGRPDPPAYELGGLLDLCQGADGVITGQRDRFPADFLHCCCRYTSGSGSWRHACAAMAGEMSILRS